MTSFIVVVVDGVIMIAMMSSSSSTKSKSSFVIVKRALSEDEVWALREECDALARAARARRTDASDDSDLDDETVEDENEGCLDAFALARMFPSERSDARVNAEAYARARERAARAARGADASSASASDASRVANVVLRSIPRTLRENVDIECEFGASKSGEIFLFNEHYVVKGGRSRSEFAWHRDGDEQLALRIARSTPKYVSAWCPLDDVSDANGTLRFRGAREGEVAVVDAEAGDVVFFASDVEHSSGANGSSTARRVFYAQYSFERIYASALDATPLAFAVPTLR